MLITISKPKVTSSYWFSWTKSLKPKPQPFIYCHK